MGCLKLTLTVLCILCYILCVSGFLTDVGYVTTNCNPSLHNPDAVARSVEKAKKMLSVNSQDPPASEKLLIMILFSNGFHSDHHAHSRLDFLKCSLQKLQRNLMNHTTTDVFIWTLKHSLSSTETLIPKWFNAADFPRMHIIDIEPESWTIPCGLKNDTLWAVREHFDLEYYLMGRWRLTFALDFAKDLGYKYHLQYDDDALLNKKINYNLVKKMEESKNMNHFYHNNQEMVRQGRAGPLPPPNGNNRQFPNKNFNLQLQQQAASAGVIDKKYNTKDCVFDINNNITGYHMGVLNDVEAETQNVVLGLPELTAFWLKINRFNPRGTLIDHLSPKSINSGLFSGFQSSDGWDRKYFKGFFIIINLEVWFLPEVQDYLTTVLRSGRDIEGRWQEQAVMNMIQQVFIPANKLAIFNDIEVLHDRHKKSTFETWCIGQN